MIAERYYAGETLRGLSGEFGMHIRKIRAAIVGQGVEIRKQGNQHGPRGSRWRGGVRKRRDGYVLQWVSDDSPMAAMRCDGSYVIQHRLVMAEALGRPLYRHEEVHHINGDRSDNRLANLELWTKSQPSGQRVEDKLRWAHEIIAQYQGVTVGDYEGWPG